MGTGPDVDCEAELSVKHPLFPRERRGEFESKYKLEKYALPEPTGFAGARSLAGALVIQNLYIDDIDSCSMVSDETSLRPLAGAALSKFK
jgi:hypothetical protein